jgi:hypothetical protein
MVGPTPSIQCDAVVCIPLLPSGVPTIKSCNTPASTSFCKLTHPILSQEIITISKDKLPGYEEKIKMFYEEHIHSDEEIRYILDGTGGEDRAG